MIRPNHHALPSNSASKANADPTIHSEIDYSDLPENMDEQTMRKYLGQKLNVKPPLSDSKKDTVSSLSDHPNSKSEELVATFHDDEAEPEEVDSKVFRYGEYLEYWGKRGSNRVWPRYTNLKQELLLNKVLRITEEKYNELHKQAEQLLLRAPLIAKHVGNMNKDCDIEEGSEPTVWHMIALLIYTDFKNHQFQFKKQCRRLYTNEPLRELVQRNSEVYHWSKLIKEMCIFYGEIMGENDVLYTGLGQSLIFNALCTRFECPISTSTKLSVAQRFGDAIILKFKRGSANTKILDVEEYSNFGKKSDKNEHERLVAGSTLRIVDIMINGKWQKSYVSALRMLEQIMNGHFIDGNKRAAQMLLTLLRCAISPTLTDQLRNLGLIQEFYAFVEGEGHDSDSLIDDIHAKSSSEISERFVSSVYSKVSECCNEYIGILLNLLI